MSNQSLQPPTSSSTSTHTSNSADTDIRAAGVALLAHSDPVRALALVSKAIAGSGVCSGSSDLLDAHVDLLDLRAMLLAALGRFSDALVDANTVVQARPQLSTGYLRAAKILKKQNMDQRAFKVYRIAVQKVSANDPGKKKLEAQFIELATKLGVSVKRQKRKPLEESNKSSAANIQEPSQESLQCSQPDAFNFGPVNLPFEIIQTIFELLPLTDRIKCLRVCCSFRAMLSSNAFLWRTIRISNNRLTDAGFTTLVRRGGAHISSVVLANCAKLSNGALRSLTSTRCAQRLAVLELAGSMRVTADAIANFVTARHSALRRVNLSRTRVDDSGVDAVVNNCRAALRELVLSECADITDGALDGVVADALRGASANGGGGSGGVSQLELLDISRNPQLTDRFVQNAARSFPRLRTANLDGLERATHRAVDALAMHCKELAWLDITGLSFAEAGANDAGNRNSLEVAIIKLASECKGFKALRLAACKYANDGVVDALTVLCSTGIESLEFPQSANITDMSLMRITRRCKSIKALDLSWCPRVTDAGVAMAFDSAFGGLGQQLQRLNLSRNPRVTDKGLLALALAGVRAAAGLVELNISGCEISDAGVAAAFGPAPGTAAAAGEVLSGAAPQQRFAALRVLRIDACPRVGNALVEKLRQWLPRTRVSANLNL
ncbi:hypothetical protein HDU82_004325 [Entophlyctis luteolus]|nr:hypothetical protein HDU82_004325 [Entophlyctis luteolus]